MGLPMYDTSMEHNTKETLWHIIRTWNWLLWLIRGTLVGVCVGPLMFLLSSMIHWATALREANPFMLLFIPVGGVLTSLLFHWSGAHLRHGTNLAIERINFRRLTSSPKESGDTDDLHVPISPKIIPLMFVNTAMTHLSGASGGKEDAGVQIGTTIAGIFDWMEARMLAFFGHPRSLLSHADQTRIWMVTGAGAAFAGLFNAPMAGTWFGVQFASPKITRTEAFLPSLAGSFSASLISQWLGNHPISLPVPMEIVQFNAVVLLKLCLAGFIFGLLSRFVAFMVHGCKHLMRRTSDKQVLRSLYASLALLAATGLLFLLTGTFKYNGLSLGLFAAASEGSVAWYDPLGKILLTALTIAAGFSGGEIIPLMVIGGTTGSLLAPLFGLPPIMMTIFGAMGTLSGATKLPMVCFLLCMELFGTGNVTLMFATCMISFISSGRESIYESQSDPISNKKKPLLQQK